ncbi:hypothetical protein FOZ62_005113 [Perkinsus olseni]|uniref:Uncharacterized protein n=1 Tax=Perkinsus olseni TaxID=32597 RepID=A0A7J6U917_PEROL|nr:hypothetical protein FOZ62_005113 [Perkinsus olseni]
MRFAILPLAVVAMAQVSLGQDSCPTGDAQCDAEMPGSYCKFYQGNRVCQGTDTPCYCTTTPPPPPSPTPSAGPCPDGDAYCQQQTGDPTSYCKAAYQFGPGGGVCQGSDEPCTCGGGPTSPGPTSAGPTPTMAPTTSR